MEMVIIMDMVIDMEVFMVMDINIDMVMHHLGTLINDRGFSGSALIQEIIRITLNEGSISFSNFRPKSSVGMFCVWKFETKIISG